MLLRWSRTCSQALKAHSPTTKYLHTMAQSTKISITALNKQITLPTGLFIDNEFVPSVDSTEELIQYVRASSHIRYTSPDNMKQKGP